MVFNYTSHAIPVKLQKSSKESVSGQLSSKG